jgi:hypothetical protein
LGQCSKEIPLADYDFLGNLDQLDIAEVGTAVKLMPLMLCSTHWGKTVYYNALFLDWLSSYGSKQSVQDHEDIVTDYQSAKVINDGEQNGLGPSTLDVNDQERSASAPGSQAAGKILIEPNGDEDRVSHIGIEQPVNFDSAALVDNSSDTMAIPSNENDSQLQDNSCSSRQFILMDPANEDGKEKPSEVRILMSLDAYASLELGVAKLEIMNQESLKCIAMTSDGWRCQELIEEESLLQARTQLRSSDNSQDGFERLAKLVLCFGHARGQLPQIYSENWYDFATKRLTKEDAMSKFNAEQWMSVQFFNNQPAPHTELRKTRSASHLPLQDGIGHSSKPPAHPPIPPERHRRLSDQANFSFNFKCASQKPREPLQSSDLFGGYYLKVIEDAYFSQDGRLTTTSSTITAPEPPVLTRPPGSTLTAGHPQTPNDPHHAANGSHLRSSTNSNWTFDKSTSPQRPTKGVIIPWKGKAIRVRLPPKPPVSSDTSDTSRGSADMGPPGEVIEQSSNSPLVNQTVAPEDPRSSRTLQHPDASVPSMIQESRSRSAQTCRDDTDALLMAEIKSPIKRGGYVQVISSRNLLKIGRATDVIRRRQQIEEKCQLADLEEVEIRRFYSTYHERVQRLVHLELQNFQAKFDCSHLSGRSSQEAEQEHREWFDVPAQEAIQSVTRWCDFVEKAYTSDGTITEHWGRMTLRMPGSELSGLFKSRQQARGDRYENWIEVGLLR